MIEIFDAKRTRSYGCFASFKVAINTLNLLAYEGISSVFVATYRNNVLQREYEAVYSRGKWRIPKKRKQELSKEYVPTNLIFY